MFATRTSTTWRFATALTWTDNVVPLGFDASGRRFLVVRDDQLVQVRFAPGRSPEVETLRPLPLDGPRRPFLAAGGERLVVSPTNDRVDIFDATDDDVGLLGSWEGVAECRPGYPGWWPGGYHCVIDAQAPWQLRGWLYDAPSAATQASALPVPPDAWFTFSHAYVPGRYIMAEISTPQQQEALAWTLGPEPRWYRLTGPQGFIDPFVNVSSDRRRVVIAAGSIIDPQLWVHDLSRLPNDSLLWQGPGDNLQSLWRPDGTGLLFARPQDDPPTTWWLDFAFDATPTPRLVYEGIGTLQLAR